MRDTTNELEMLGITVDGKLVHRGKNLGDAAVAKLLITDEEVVVVPIGEAHPGDIVGIATGEDYEKVCKLVEAKNAYQ